MSIHKELGHLRPFRELTRRLNDCSNRAEVKLGSLAEINRMSIGSQLSSSTPKVLRVAKVSLIADCVLLMDSLSSESAAGMSNKFFI